MKCKMFDTMPRHPGYLNACQRCDIRKACKDAHESKPLQTIGKMLKDTGRPEDKRFKRKPPTNKPGFVHWSQTPEGKVKLAEARKNSHISRARNKAAREATTTPL